MNREEWLLYRKAGLGGSDAPIIMGESPYKTILELYEEKTSDTVEEIDNPAIRRGNEFEPKIRAYYNIVHDSNFQPALVMSKDYDFIRCSLDGKHEEEIMEIKTVGRLDFEAGVVPKKYQAQLQHNLFCSGAKVLKFIMFYDPKWESVAPDFVKVIDVYPDEEYQSVMIKKEIEFWTENVLKRKPPVPTDRDYKKMDGAEILATEYLSLINRQKEIETEIERVKTLLVAMAEEKKHPRLFCPGIRMRKESRAGTVEYAKIPELKNIDLNKYRKPGTTFWKIEREKE